jgi:hypothetical protein
VEKVSGTNGIVHGVLAFSRLTIAGQAQHTTTRSFAFHIFELFSRKRPSCLWREPTDR